MKKQKIVNFRTTLLQSLLIFLMAGASISATASSQIFDVEEEIANNQNQASNPKGDGPDAVGISQNTSGQMQARVFPNPSKGQFNFQASQDNHSGFEVQVFDLLGNKVWEGIFNNTNSIDIHVDLTSQGPGLYLIWWGPQGPDKMIEKWLFID